jgi:hypothetical protein
MKDSSAYELENMEPVLHSISTEVPVGAPTDAPATSDLQSATNAVWNALNSDRYDWRSVDGIAEETGLDKLAISTILETQLGSKVVRAVDSNQPENFLYATRDRYNKVRGPWNRVLSVIANQVK